MDNNNNAPCVEQRNAHTLTDTHTLTYNNHKRTQTSTQSATIEICDKSVKFANEPAHTLTHTNTEMYTMHTYTT